MLDRILLATGLVDALLFLTWLTRSFGFFIFYRTSLAVFLAFARGDVSLETCISRSDLAVTLTRLSFFPLFPALFFGLVDHFPKLLVLPPLLLFLLYFIFFPFPPLLFEAAPPPSLGIPSLVLEHRFIIDILHGRDLGDDGLPVVRNLLGKLIVLEVDYCDFRHFH